MKEKVLSIVNMKGPLLPIEICKALNLDSLMAGAYLSELYSNKRIKISHLKVGGSPVYYVQGQEAKLQNFMHVLKLPEKKTYELLKEKKVLKDTELDPVTRVCCQNIKDFAKPIEITQNDKKELYWKWYLTRNDELQGLLNPVKQEPKVQEPVKETVVEKPVPVVEKTPESVKEKPKPVQEVKEEPKEKEPKSELNKPKSVHEPVVPKETPTEERTSPQEETKEEIEPKSSFDKKVHKFFEDNKISIIDKKIIRSDSEIEYDLLIPSAVGKIHYYAVAKSKKKLNDADLSQIFVNATMAKLPALLIHEGEMTKKTKEKLKHEFKLITTYKI